MNVPNPRGSIRPSTPPEPRLIKLPEVMRITGLKKTSIYTQMKKGNFPKQVPMGVVRCAFWSNREIYKWVESPTEYFSKRELVK